MIVEVNVTGRNDIAVLAEAIHRLAYAVECVNGSPRHVISEVQDMCDEIAMREFPKNGRVRRVA